MLQVNMHEAKTNLSSLIASGETFIIAKAGKPVVTVTPYVQTQEKKLRVGFMTNISLIPDGFDRMGESEIFELFEGAE